jgi:hypothetical protein
MDASLESKCRRANEVIMLDVEIKVTFSAGITFMGKQDVSDECPEIDSPLAFDCILPSLQAVARVSDISILFA